MWNKYDLLTDTHAVGMWVEPRMNFMVANPTRPASSVMKKVKNQKIMICICGVQFGY